jgi:hypothetical protein
MNVFVVGDSIRQAKAVVDKKGVGPMATRRPKVLRITW